MVSKKVLIVTYYWPPAGGPGVQRWLKFTKYLPEFGIEPIVYTPENPSYPVLDKTLNQEVNPNLKIVKTKIWEPYQIAEKINPNNKKYKAGQFDSEQDQSLLTKVSVFVRGNFFIPDARKFWVKPSVNFLKEYLIENKIDTIITSGPPHSLHLIGLELKKANSKLKWITDFRDPWTEISYHSALKLTKKSHQKHLQLERTVLTTSDCVLATSFTDGENFKKLGAKRVEVITNGFEPIEVKTEKGQNSKFTITYSGGLELARNPLVIWKALRELTQSYPDFSQDFELHFYGNISSDVLRSIQKNQLENQTIEHGYVSHETSLSGIQRADLLILTNFPDEKSKGIIPGKLFEYIATQNPILAVGPANGDVEKILNATQSGRYFTHFELENVKAFILENFMNWRLGIHEMEVENIEQFSRKNLTKRLSQIIASF